MQETRPDPFRSVALHEAGSLLLSTSDDRSQKIVAVTQRILEQSQAILKREWERVKSGD